MVCRVITSLWRLRQTSTHDAPGPPVARSWHRHGVLAVETALGSREQSLSVAEHHAILVVGKRSTLEDELISPAALRRQISHTDDGCIADFGAIRRRPGLREGPADRCCQENACERKLGRDALHD